MNVINLGSFTVAATGDTIDLHNYSPGSSSLGWTLWVQGTAPTLGSWDMDFGLDSDFTSTLPAQGIQTVNAPDGTVVQLDAEAATTNTTYMLMGPFARYCRIQANTSYNGAQTFTLVIV